MTKPRVLVSVIPKKQTETRYQVDWGSRYSVIVQLHFVILAGDCRNPGAMYGENSESSNNQATACRMIPTLF